MNILRELRSAVARNRERQFVGRDPRAVVDDADQAEAAPGGRHLDAACPRVERVFNEFLHHACWPLDHFAGGNLVDDGVGELANGHAAILRGFGQVAKGDMARCCHFCAAFIHH